MQKIQQENLNAARRRQLREEFDAETERSITAEAARAAAGVSSLLFFEGEDAGYHERMQQQQQQQRNAIQEHLFQQALIDMQEKEREQNFVDFATQSCRVQEAMCQQKMKDEAQRRLETAQNNVRMAEERKRREEEWREHERQIEKREIDMKLHDPFLAEGRQDLVKGDSSLSPWLPRVATGCMGGNRDGFKGYCLAIKEAADDKNEEIRKEKEGEKIKQWEEQQQCDEFFESQRRISVSLEEERNKQRRKRATEIAEENKKLAKEQKEREEYRNKELYRKAIGVEHFDTYFCRTAR